MIRIKRVIEIDTPADRVHEFVSQPTNLPAVWPSLLSVSNVVCGRGGTKQYDWTYKMAGVQLRGQAHMQQQGPRVVLRTEGGISGLFVWTCEPRDGLGMRLTMEVDYAIPAVLVGTMALKTVAKFNERDVETFLTNLEDVLESPAVAASVRPRAH